jgi:hypothetical protein
MTCWSAFGSSNLQFGRSIHERVILHGWQQQALHELQRQTAWLVQTELCAASQQQRDPSRIRCALLTPTGMLPILLACCCCLHLQELGDARPDVQDAVAKLCCTWWQFGAENREFLVSQTLPFLLVGGVAPTADCLPSSCLPRKGMYLARYVMVLVLHGFTAVLCVAAAGRWWRRNGSKCGGYISSVEHHQHSQAADCRLTKHKVA